MSQSVEERVEHALSQLIEQLLPTYPDEDEAASDERYYDALGFATEAIGSVGEPKVASDVNHASDLIKKKLIKENTSPEKALRFANLYSRLLTQNVLKRKWAMLYFLYKLADSDDNTKGSDAGTRVLNPASPLSGDNRTASESPLMSSSRSMEKQFVVDSSAFNDTFSKDSLRRLPMADGGRTSRSARMEKDERRVGRQPPKEEDERESSSRAQRGIDGNETTKAQPLNPTEPSLLRDLPFTLQGLSSTNLVFSSPASLKLPPSLPLPTISLLYKLAEPSLLYRALVAFVESSEGGLVGQSLRSAIGLELRSYLGLVATLEGQIRKAIAQSDGAQSRQEIAKLGVTLKRCVIWTREATLGLRLMSVITENAKGKKGGELISLIHSFSLSHGDPFVSSFAERLLSHVARPFYDMLRQWIYDGELSDPYLEFFVSQNYEDASTDANGDTRKGGATSVWEDKYALNAKMIPTIISEEFANKVFLIGKSLNFIRYGCGDAGWVESYSRESSRELQYGDTAALEASIGEAYKTTMARLIHLMADKFKLFEHLQALKKYLLLGAGDFIAVLMESLASNLDRPANTQYRHTLTAQLEHAVRNSNAQYDSPDALRRLDSRMLELSHGEIGWDVFTLEYKIDAPVDVIVTPFGSKQYLKVFNFLWRVKRVEFALGTTWRRCMTGARGVLGSVEDKVGADWKRARCTVAEMIHFVNQLQYYILFEVIESSWNELQASMRRPECTLDDLIQAHSRYLTAITRKGLLGSSTMDFTAQLHELLKVMLAYRDAVDGLYSFSVAEFTRRQERSAKIETRTAAADDDFVSVFDPYAGDAKAKAKAKSGRHNVDSPVPPLGAIPGLVPLSEDDMLPALRTRLGSLAADFKTRVNVLLGDLLHQPDADMRWLAMVMNFNDVYQPVRRKRKVGEKERKGREREKDGSRVESVEASRDGIGGERGVGKA